MGEADVTLNQTDEKPPDSGLVPGEDSVVWSHEVEVCLFHAMIGHKPVGKKTLTLLAATECYQFTLAFPNLRITGSRKTVCLLFELVRCSTWWPGGCTTKRGNWLNQLASFVTAGVNSRVTRTTKGGYDLLDECCHDDICCTPKLPRAGCRRG